MINFKIQRTTVFEYEDKDLMAGKAGRRYSLLLTIYLISFDIGITFWESEE